MWQCCAVVRVRGVTASNHTPAAWFCAAYVSKSVGKSTSLMSLILNYELSENVHISYLLTKFGTHSLFKMTDQLKLPHSYYSFAPHNGVLYVARPHYALTGRSAAQIRAVMSLTARRRK